MLQFQNIHASYGKQKILNGIDFTLPNNQLTVLLGKNGCGKSTFISCLNNQIHYTGDIFLNGKNIKQLSFKQRAQHVAILPQYLTNVAITVEELVQMGRNPYLSFGQRLSQQDLTWIDDALTLMNIQSLRHKKLHQLSGGERQKAYLAMILAQNTDIIILDEPTTYIDMAYEAEFLQLLVLLKEQYQKTIFIIMHDLTSALSIADYVAIMDNGTLLYTDTSKNCLQTTIIETTFGVKKYAITEHGHTKILYHN